MIAEALLISLFSVTPTSLPTEFGKRQEDDVIISYIKSESPDKSYIKSESLDKEKFSDSLLMNPNDNIDSILEGFNNIIDREKVKDYLLAHRGLIGVISEAQVIIRNIFPKNILIKAEVFDFMDESGGDELLVTIQSQEDVYDYLEKFEEDWWFGKMPEAFGNLNFTV